MADEFGSKEAGSKGGKARAGALSKEERSAIAREAAEARWTKAGKQPIPKATHSGELEIGNAKIPCYVLENGERVVSTRGMMQALARRWRGRKYTGTELPVFVEAKNLSPFIDKDMRAVLSVLQFRTPKGVTAEGFRAEVVPAVCEIYLRARKAEQLTTPQQRVADQCEILMRGLAHVGIIALVDEATGYERDRERNALAKILEAFVAKELQKWVKTFPLEFYELICEVRGEPIQRAMKRPAYLGSITNDLIYKRLAPGVLDSLRQQNPIVESGRRRHKHHQFLTPDMGHPKLREHLAGVMGVLRVAKFQKIPWRQFQTLVDKTHPRQPGMPLFDQATPG